MRRKDREITDLSEITGIIDRAKILHLAMFDEEYPYVVPLHYGYEMKDEMPVFYCHSANEGHKLDLIRRNSNVTVELECDVELISAGDDPCSYGSYFASVIARSKAEIVDDEAEKIHALKVFMLHQTDREFEFTSRMAAGVTVIKVTPVLLTAKAKKKQQ